MIPIASDLTTLVASCVGDIEPTVSPQSITGARIQQYFILAWTRLYEYLEAIDAVNVQRSSFFLLPAFQSILSPATAHLPNLGQLDYLYERNLLSSWAISAASITSGDSPYVTVTTPTHDLADGDIVEVFGVDGLTDDVNDSWTVTIPDTTHVRLMGATPGGAYTSGGKVMKGQGDWSEVTFRRDDVQFGSSVRSSLGMYTFLQGKFRFPPCNLERELKITYTLSGNAPSLSSGTNSLLIDDSLRFLGLATAGHYVSLALGQAQKGSGLLGQAEEALQMIRLINVRQLQTSDEPMVPPPFRYRRNNRLAIW